MERFEQIYAEHREAVSEYVRRRAPEAIVDDVVADTDGFPSAKVQALTFPVLTRLQGVAADGVATVEALDANGNVLDSTPDENNLFASTTTELPEGATVAIRTLDANGTVTATEPLPATALP